MLWLILLLLIPPAALTAWKKLGSPLTTHRAGPTVEQIRRLATLVTARITITDAQETTLSGRLGCCRAVLLVRGEVLIGPDLSQAKILATDSVNRQISIELPEPRVLSARLDHDGTRLVSLGHEGLWLIVPGDAGRTRVLNDAYRRAEEALQQAAARADIAEDARLHARQVMVDFFGTDGWRVEIRWKAGP